MPATPAPAVDPAADGSPATPRRLDGPLGLLLVVVAWLVVLPYYGVRHDAILYLGQALRHLQPDIFGRDLFFSHGSQDQFTIVSTPLAWLLAQFGTGPAELALTAAANLAFIGAAWILCGELAPTRRWICTLGVALLSHTYGSLEIFSYGEGFFTARSVAEPLALLALVAWTRGRDAAAAPLFALAMLAHPLVAIPALVVAWLMRVAVDRRWLWALAAIVPILALAWAGVKPFAGLFERFDEPWWRIVGEGSAQVEMAQWKARDLVSAALDFAFLALARVTLGAAARRLATGVLLACAVLLPTAWVGGDVVRDVLVVQLQLWRVLWLAHLLAMACVPAVALALWRGDAAQRLAAAAALVALLAMTWELPHAWIFVAWFAATLAIRRRAHEVAPSLLRAALAATVLAIALVTTVLGVMTWRGVSADAVLAGRVHPALALLAIPSLGIAATAAVGWLASRLSVAPATALVLALLAAGALQWDQRSEWHRTIEDPDAPSHSFEPLIPEHAQVYWHTELLPTWALLHRASWISSPQGAGTAFNRATALEFWQRYQSMQAMIVQQASCQMAADAAGANVECQPSQATVEAFCRQPGGPDFVVFDAPYPHGLVAQWDYRVGLTTPVRTAHLYDCAKMR